MFSSGNDMAGDDAARLKNSLSEVSDEALSLIRRLSQIGVSLSSERNLQKLLQTILEEVCSLLSADGGTLYLLEEDKLQFKISRNKSLGIRSDYDEDHKMKPIPLNPSFVSAYSVLHGKTVNIDDVYRSDLFDFTGPKKFDKETGYHTTSLLVVPLKDHEGKVTGAMQLVNAFDPVTGEVGKFNEEYVILAESLASQAAVAIDNSRLLLETERLFEAFLQVMATGLDARSKYTHGHVRRVAGLTMEIARAVNSSKEGHYADIQFNEIDLREIWIAGWMHDIGKIVSPTHIMDKATKLEGIHDNVELVKERFARLKESVKSDGLQKELDAIRAGCSEEEIEEIRAEAGKKRAEIIEDEEFVVNCNSPKEFMSDDSIEKLISIARKWKRGDNTPLLDENDIYCLSIRRGSLTEEERKVMQDHIVVTIRMLEKIPFPEKLKSAPLYAGSHHETLDGKGYPLGLSSEEMPIQSRMLAVADFLEALTARDRPYKKAMSFEQAMSILHNEAKKGKLDANLINLVEEKDVFSLFQQRDAKGDYFV